MKACWAVFLNKRIERVMMPKLRWEVVLEQYSIRLATQTLNNFSELGLHEHSPFYPALWLPSLRPVAVDVLRRTGYFAASPLHKFF